MAAPKLRTNESGAVLVLALVFMVAAALMVVPLAGYATSNLGNTYNLGVNRDVLTAADSIMDDAIESVRYSMTQGRPDFTSPPGSCSVTVPALAEGSSGTQYPIQVTCEGYPLTSTNPGCTPTTQPGCAFTDSTASREVVFFAKSGGSTIVQAVVEYWDFLPSCTSNCVATGYATKIVSWSVTPANG